MLLSVHKNGTSQCLKQQITRLQAPYSYDLIRVLLHRTYMLQISRNGFSCKKSTAYNQHACFRGRYAADLWIFPSDREIKTCNKPTVPVDFPLHTIHSVTVTCKSTPTQICVLLVLYCYRSIGGYSHT